MKPVNLDTSPCSPIASNCVVWTGPNIPCINLCKGDTVSDVVFKLATELCTVLDILNVENYDLSCLNITACGPSTFTELIQYLIERICTLNGVNTTDTRTTESGCPDCVVSVATCLQTNGQTTMNLVDYVQLIANKICTLITQITEIQNQIESLEIRVTVLENTPAPTFTIPSFTVACTIGTINAKVTETIDTILEEFINSVWCPFYTITGTTTELATAIGVQCLDGTNDSRANPGIQLNVQYPSWVNTPATVADTITNIWLAICDLYNGQVTVSVFNTSTVDMTVSGGPNYIISAAISDTGWVDLEGFDFYTGGMVSQKPQCRRIGNVIHFRGTVFVPMSSTNDYNTLIPLSASSTYNSVAEHYVFTGVDGTYGNGVLNNANGSISFNRGISVIPTSVWNSNTDGTVSMGWTIATRQININTDYGTALSAPLNIILTNTGVLLAATLKDLELSTTRSNGMRGGAHLRMITSNIVSGQIIPNYINVASNIQNLAAAGPNAVTLESEFTSQTAVTADLKYPFSCDAGEELQIGGFAFRIDGLMSYIAP